MGLFNFVKGNICSDFHGTLCDIIVVAVLSESKKKSYLIGKNFVPRINEVTDQLK